MEQKEKSDEPKDASPTEKKLISDALRKERSGMTFSLTAPLIEGVMMLE